MPYKLFLTTRQTTNIRNAFTNNMSTDTNLSKVEICKIIQSGGSFSSWLGNLRKKALTNIAIILARGNLPELVTILTSNAINKFERKLSGKGAVRVSKWFTLFISNENLNDIIRRFGGINWWCYQNIKRWNIKARKRTSWGLSSFNFSSFISATSNLFSRLIIISITSLDLMAFYQETIYLEKKMEHMP